MNPLVLTVSQLNQRARQAIESALPLLWVSGEISNLTRAASGHVYFTLKDETAQVRCVMFRSRAQIVPWRLENGQQVEAQALVSLYEARGDFQLNIEGMRRAGLGRLYEAFARLRAKLEDEGLFAAEKKRALPSFPRRIAIVSSPQAAALQDIIIALARRAPHVPLQLFPTPVQGDTAAPQIAAAIAAAGKSDCDVVLLARGGGSIEDLWAFNEEVVARAIAACPLPVIAGIGHETDISIADFAADVRVATPTAAAELVSASWFAVAERLRHIKLTLRETLQRQIQARMQRIDLLGHRLISPQQRLKQNVQELAHLRTRLGAATQRTLQRSRSRLEQAKQGLALLSPVATLERGYSIVRNAHGEIIRSSLQLQAGEHVAVQLAKGEASAKIESLKHDLE